MLGGGMADRIRRATGGSYAWVVFAVTFVTLLGAAGFRSKPRGLPIPSG